MLERYLERGGRLVALLEPGVESGLEALLGRWGIQTPDEVIVDPASGRSTASRTASNPIVYNYETHPVDAGPRPRPHDLLLRRAPARRRASPGPDDELRALVLASPRSWLTPDLAVLSGRRRAAAARRARGRTTSRSLAAGRYPRAGGETRIVAFGDSDFASNRYLRALYNLDLVLNAVHWALEREPEITLRPKLRTPDQFPLPSQARRSTCSTASGCWSRSCCCSAGGAASGCGGVGLQAAASAAL